MHNISCLVKAPLSKERSSGSNKSTSITEVNVFSEASAIAKKFSSSHTHTFSMKSNRSRGGSLMAGLSVIADNKAKEKLVSLSQRNRSDQENIHSLVKSSQPNGIDKLSKEEQNAYQNEIDQNKVEIAVALVPRKKKRKMLNRMDRNKKCKSEKVNHAECVSNDSTANDSPCLQTSGSPPNVNSADIKVRISNANQERRLLKPPRKKQSETSLYVASALSPEVGKLEENENKKSCNEKIYHEVLQVDRILGCRIRNQSSYTVQTNGISTLQAENQAEGERLQFNLPCSDFIGQENHDHLDDCCADSRIVDGTNSEFELNKDQELAEKNVVDDSCEFGADGQDKALLTNHYRDIPGIIGFSDSQSSIAHCMNEKVVELFEGSVNEDLIKAPAIKKDSKGSIIVGYASDKCKDHHTRVTGIPVTSEPQDIHLIKTVSKPDQSIENIVLSHPVEGLRLEENDSVSYEFFVKWVGKSNIHNSWVCEAQLKHLAKRKLDNYKAKYGTAIINICEDQWFQPQRIISLHESDSGGEALIKWTGLPYDECTWESIDDNVIQNSFNLISEFKRFEIQAVETDARYDIAKNEIKQVLSLPEQPKELKGGLLFPHQLEALNWLRRCWYKSKNVILADEMGLGKTVSACSFISSLFCEFKVKLPCLVLVPLSTMPNWLAEFASWAPHLNVVEYHGCAKARSLIRLHEWHASVSDKSHKRTKSYKFNVLLTTYEMILADSFHLRGVQWELLVVDEGHRLKNSASKLFSLLNSFSFQHRVLLTGTPLQNNIGEMYNLLNFLQPISFPSLSAFEEKFNDLTTAEKVEELKKLVAPHMLRRLKKDAMQNIPPKTERMVPVELTSVQAEYYRAMLTKNYQLLRNIGKGVAQQSMLNIVMQLRKVCNHPYLIPGTEPESGSAEFLQEMRIKASAKLSLLHSMLKILRKDGHRVLIFSQMTKLLDILEDYLTVEYGHGTFERVDGSVSVSDRQAAISRFNKDPTRFVFLLSTRSCGLGINLATADTVFIYDSDFNPHADIQAMNRAHRIGQSKRLLVYRLVVRASVEERILQLAKRKLMLDQLFVNKSGSQKEVEDILRWGTKELFSDYDAVNGHTSKENSINKVDCTSFREQKHRRRIGGLGDVYKDRCTDVGSKVIWDENAIIKLLDRSDLQTNMSENTDGDLDIDLLGSVKSLEWTDEQLNGESGGAETIAHLTGNGCELSVTKEDNSFTVTDENEWDRLLRDRWGKYQLEEEALLGRGKRLRKAVSYRENFTSIPKENLIENANEDESVKEYSIAGRALREKYMMLRARQKGRIASRNTMEVNSSGEQPDPLMQSPIPDSKEGQHANSNVHSEDSSNLGPLATPYCSKDSDCSLSKEERTSYHGIHLSLSGLSSDRNPPNFVPSSMLLPVLGLCAPNAGLKNSTSQNFNSPIHRSASNPDLRKKSICLPEFPFAPVLTRGPLNDNYEAGQETTELSLLSDTPGEARHHRLKKIIPDSYFPFGPPVLPTSGICPSDPSANLGTYFTSFRERMGLPNLVSDEVAPLKYAVPSGVSMKLQTDLPHLSLCSNIKLENGSGKDLPDVPLHRCFEPEFNEALKQKQVMTELLPALNIGLLQTGHSLPETHTKLLDSIMFNAQTDAQEFIKKRLKADAWSEDELDALWIGIRRHGKGNWGAIVGDSKLKILKRRSVEELLSKWNEEQHKILDGPVPTPKISKSASFLGLSDGMMARALHSSKFASSGSELPKFRSHLTDIQLGFDDVVPSFPLLEPSSHSEVPNESLPSLSSLRSHKHDANYFGNFSSGSVERFGMENLPLEQAFHCSSFSGSVGTSGMKFSSSCNMQQDDDVSARNKRMKLPSLLEKSLSLLRETQNFHFEGSRLGVLRDAKRMQATSKSQIEDIPCGSKEKELPHWLREAVNAPKHPVAALPPSISAISYSIRVLFGENKFIIPPFIIPEPPSVLPKDPRKRLKKKRKWNKLGQTISGNLSPADIMDISAACSLPAKSPLMEYSDAPVPPFTPYSIPPASSYLISSAPTLPPSSIPVIPSLMPCFTSSTIPLMTSSLPQVPLMFPFKFPHSLPMMPSSIHQSPTFISSSATASTALPPPFLPESALLPSTSQAPSLMFCSIPPLSPKRKYSSPVDSPPMPCPVPLARCLPGLGRNGTEFTLPSLNLNLNFPSTFYGVQTMQSGAIPSPIPATLSLVAPCLDHAPSMSSISDVPSTSNQDKKFLASDSSDYSHQVGVDFVGDLKNIPYEADGSYELTCMLPGKTEY